MPAEAISLNAPAAFGVARSFTGRRWTMRACDEDVARALAREHGISFALSRLLAARGIASGEVREYLNPTLRRLLPEPFTLKDMERAVARTKAAIEAGEKIAVFGDYDVDGSCSAALVSEFLAALGRPPRLYIPDRMTEGYGPNAAALLKLKEEGAGLVITVDCGAGALSALTAVRAAGLDVIVLDHHAVEMPPPAYAQVNPNQPGDASGLGHVCAAGVTFLFLVALNRALRESGWYVANGIGEPDLRAYLDLVGLATVCDVVPLIGLNRAFVRGGLARLGELSRPGLSGLAGIARIAPPFTAHHLGFFLGPRINAGGRIGKCSLGVELLTAKSADAAQEIAAVLDIHNRERQAMEAAMLESAVATASMQDNAPFLLLGEEGWHPGIVGIVAGRLKDRFGKPAFVAGFEGGMGRGSARSVAGLDIGAVVRAARDAGILDSGGGHAMAAGFSLTADRLEAFREFVAAQFENLAAIETAAEIEIDALVSPAAAGPGLVEEFALAGPYGAGNPEPYVAVPDARVMFADVVGRDHVKFRLAGGDGARLDAIAFRAATTPLGEGILAARGKLIHVAGRLKKDEWQGRIRVQLQADDAALASA